MIKSHRSGCDKLNGGLEAGHLACESCDDFVTCGASGFSLVTLCGGCVARNLRDCAKPSTIS